MVKQELSIYDELSEERKRLQKEGKLPKWCTTIAWQMLKEKNLSPEYPDLASVYTRIAKHAASYTPNPAEWQPKFFELLWNGWLAASTPVLSNMGTGFGCPVSCFVAGTIVNTSNGLVQIENLKIGDKVLTHTGTYKSVINTMNRESDDLYELEFMGEVFFVTGNHLILTQENNWVRVDELDPAIHNIVQILTKNSNNTSFKIKKIQKSSTVYDITVEEDHSFTVGDCKMVVHNCSGGFVQDSVYGFYGAQQEAAVLSKNGFGTSGYLGAIRHRGAKINGVKGGASGVLPVFKDFVQMSRDISQGSQRRGAWAGYLEIDHPDFYEIVNYISKNPDDANIGWNITDKFIQRLDNGDKDAVERYQAALKLKMITGKGYFEFIDKVNRLNPKMYKDRGLTVKASNLCLSGDTRIKILGDISGELDVSMEHLNSYLGKNDDVENWKVWSFNIKTFSGEWKKITVSAQTEKNARLMKVTDTVTGKFIKCTPSHLIFTKNRGYVEAKNLIQTDILVIR